MIWLITQLLKIKPTLLATYDILLNITEGEIHTKKQKRRFCIPNIHDNKLKREQMWEGSDLRLKQAISDISWEFIVKSRVLVFGNINANSSM